MAKLLLGVCGGISAYKAPALVRALIQLGHEVRVVLTEAATHFVSELALTTVSGNPVRRDLFDLRVEAEVGHIELADWADAIVVAPATADLMARYCSGRAEDLLSTVLLATRAPVFLAPAMNSNMWSHAATQHNVQQLEKRGVTLLGPIDGELACGWTGLGKMLDVPELAASVDQRIGGQRDWEGRRIWVTAGPTREYLDPVRFLSNASTGVMGFALAQAAAARGARVSLVAGPVDVATPAGVHRVNVQSGEEMYEALRAGLSSEAVDWVFKVAAVADFRVAGASSNKLEKAEFMKTPPQFVPARDVLADLAAQFGAKTRFLGFAAQTIDASLSPAQTRAELIRLGTEKLARKKCHALFVNRVGTSFTGFGVPTNAGYLLQKSASSLQVTPVFEDGPRSKREVADALLTLLAETDASSRAS